MKRKDTQKIALTGVFIAIIAIMTYTPFLGYINLGFISGTTIFIPVIIGIIVLRDFRYSIVLGLAFGGLSMLKAWTMPENVADYWFRNPMISVLPRLLIIIAGHYVYMTLSKMTKMKWKPITYGATAFATALANSVFVLTSLIIFISPEELGSPLMKFFFGTLVVVSLPEIALGVIVTILIMIPTQIFVSRLQERMNK